MLDQVYELTVEVLIALAGWLHGRRHVLQHAGYGHPYRLIPFVFTLRAFDVGPDIGGGYPFAGNELAALLSHDLVFVENCLECGLFCRCPLCGLLGRCCCYCCNRRDKFFTDCTINNQGARCPLCGLLEKWKDVSGGYEYL